MEFEFSDKVKALRERLQAFMDDHVYPNEATHSQQLNGAADRWQPVPIVEELKQKAKDEGLWNLFLAHSKRGAGLTNLEYAPLARSWAGCSGPARCSTAPPPTPATWKRSSCTAPTSRSAAGWSPCWPARSARRSA